MKYIRFFVLTALMVSCSAPKDSEPSLRKKYEPYFTIGAAIGSRHLQDYDTVLLKQHFSGITAENDMKPQRTINKKGEFTFEAGDRIVEYARKNGMEVRGHTLVWYNQTDPWFYRDSAGIFLTKEKMLERLKWYICQVLEHYRGRVYGWDVVNEAISDSDSLFYREDIDWFRVCGPEYIEKAFVYAHECDPDIKLYYNDYDLINPKKAQKVYQMLKDFVARGIPVHGVGMQGHWTLEDVNASNLAASIDLFASLGLEVQITEMDISIYPYYHNTPRELLPKEVREFTPELEARQAEKYKEVFSVLREKSDKVTSVTFWGVADDKSWLSHYFVPGRIDHPLLFNPEFKPKKAFGAIMDF